MSSHGKLVVGSPRIIRGQPAFALNDTTEGGILYIAATGPPLPLEVTSSAGKGAINFEAWNQPTTLQAPKGAIALASIKG